MREVKILASERHLESAFSDRGDRSKWEARVCSPSRRRSWDSAGYQLWSVMITLPLLPVHEAMRSSRHRANRSKGCRALLRLVKCPRTWQPYVITIARSTSMLQRRELACQCGMLDRTQSLGIRGKKLTTHCRKGGFSFGKHRSDSPQKGLVSCLY